MQVGNQDCGVCSCNGLSLEIVFNQRNCSKRLAMSHNLQELVEKYHAFYEMLPYHVVIEEGHGLPNPARHIIQAGLDVDVHGVSNKCELELAPLAEYALDYAELKKIADAVSHHMSECSIEVIPFPSTVFSDVRKHQSEAVLRIRISHYGNVDQRAGLPEQHALEEVEKELQDLVCSAAMKYLSEIYLPHHERSLTNDIESSC